jgi:hypothetical protein
VCLYRQGIFTALGISVSSARLTAAASSTSITVERTRRAPQCPTFVRSNGKPRAHDEEPLQAPIGAACAATSYTWFVGTSVRPASDRH